jgi:regulator of replication initiation timing
MEIEVRQEDLQAVMQANPMMVLQVENQALRRKLQETQIAFDASMMENERLAEELDERKNGSKLFQMMGDGVGTTKEEDMEING